MCPEDSTIAIILSHDDGGGRPAAALAVIDCHAEVGMDGESCGRSTVFPHVGVVERGRPTSGAVSHAEMVGGVRCPIVRLKMLTTNGLMFDDNELSPPPCSAMNLSR